MRTKSGPNGFTLVEIVIVVAIIGILAAVATPGIMTTLQLYRLRAEARELVINFKKAKFEAVRRNREVVLAFTPGVGSQSGSYQIFVKNNNSNVYTYQPATDSILNTQQIRQNVILSNVTFTNNNTWYDSRGMVALAKIGNCELRTVDDWKRLRVVLLSTGVVRTESSSDQGVTWRAQ